MKIGKQIKFNVQKMFLIRDFCMEKLLGREAIIFPEKKKVLKFYEKKIKKKS